MASVPKGLILRSGLTEDIVDKQENVPDLRHAGSIPQWSKPIKQHASVLQVAHSFVQRLAVFSITPDSFPVVKCHSLHVSVSTPVNTEIPPSVFLGTYGLISESRRSSPTPAPPKSRPSHLSVQRSITWSLFQNFFWSRELVKGELFVDGVTRSILRKGWSKSRWPPRTLKTRLQGFNRNRLDDQCPRLHPTC